MEKSIMVLGRGMSLKKLADFDHSQFDTIILANSFFSKNLTNTFNHEKKYCDDPLIHSFIKDKKIIVICSPYQNFFKDDINSFKKKYNVIGWYKTLFSKDIRIGKDGDVFKILPDSVLEDYKKMRHIASGTHSLAITYAIKELNYKNIYMFGKDFYEKDYYISNNIKNLNPSNWNHHFNKETVKILKEKFSKFIKFYSDINFFLYTLADYNPNIKNLNVL
jgi:hypothetical protein